MTRPVVIGNCSGFYGDRLAAAREMVDGGPIDVLCGDYLAELTMLILAKAQAKDPQLGYAKTFLTQVEDVLGTCLERGTKIVSNAGGLNPAGLAAAIRDVAAKLGLQVNVAHVEGDDLRGNIAAISPPVDGKPVSANAYLGGWGIAEALGAGADVVVTGRVTDASLVVGPAAWWHGWERTDFDALAGAVVAGHVIECGPQATGGNYAFLDEITDRRYPGFPIAEVAADGSSAITKHPDTGGLVSVGTVTAQLLYELQGPAYLGPDVTTHFDSIALTQEGEHRVGISGVRGSAPPETLKVALNDVGGFRNSMTLVLTGLDIEAKAAYAEELLFAGLGGKERFAEVDVRLLRFDRPDAPTNEQATAHLRVTVKDPDPRKVGRAFSNATMELALGGYAGFHTTSPPTAESAYGIYRPAAVPRDAVEQVVVHADGTRAVVANPPTGSVPACGVDRGCAGERPDAARPARNGLRRAVRRQGRQRQRRRLGPHRRRARLVARFPHPAAGARTARTGGRRARRRGARPAQPARGERRRARVAGRRRGELDAAGSAGEGAGGVPAQPGRGRARGAAELRIQAADSGRSGRRVRRCGRAPGRATSVGELFEAGDAEEFQRRRLGCAGRCRVDHDGLVGLRFEEDVDVEGEPAERGVLDGGVAGTQPAGAPGLPEAVEPCAASTQVGDQPAEVGIVGVPGLRGAQATDAVGGGIGVRVRCRAEEPLPDEVAVQRWQFGEVAEQRGGEWVPGEHVGLGRQHESGQVRHPIQQVEHARPDQHRDAASLRGCRTGEPEHRVAVVVTEAQSPGQRAEHLW